MKTLILTALAFLLCGEVLAERQVRLKAFVDVSGRTVRLQDLVADSTGLSEEELGLKIVDAPTRGYKKFSARDLAFRMQVHKELLNVTLLTPPFIKVTRKLDSDYVEKVREILKTELLKQAEWKGQTIDLDFTGDDINKINEKNGAKVVLKSQVVNDTQDRIDMRISFTDNGEDLGTLKIRPYIRRKVFMILLRRSIPKGHIIVKDDLKLAHLWSDGRDEHYASDFKDCIGYETSKTMPADGKISRKLLNEPYYVKKGEIITAKAFFGNLEVGVAAQALLDGRRGQIIRARNTKSGKVIDVQMTAPLQAKVISK